MLGSHAPTSARPDTMARPMIVNLKPFGIQNIVNVGTGAGASGCAQPLAAPRSTVRKSRVTLHGLPTLRAPLAAAAGNDPGEGQLSPEEEAAYQDLMQKRKAERKAWKMEMRRRAKFDPLATPGQPPSAPPQQQQQQQQQQPPQAAQAVNVSASPPVQRPPIAPPPLSRPPPPPPAPLARPQNLAAAKIEPPPGTQRLFQAPKASVDGGKAIGDNEGDEGLDLDAMAAMARKLIADGDRGEVATAVIEGEIERESEVVARGRSAMAASSSGRGVGSGTAAARLRARRAPAASAGDGAGAGGPTGPVKKRQLMPISQLKHQQEEAEPEEEDAEEDDGLDWDALQAYEKYEQYVKEVAAEEERSARRRAAAAPSSRSAPVKSAAAAPTTSAPGPASKGGAEAVASPAPAVVSDNVVPASKKGEAKGASGRRARAAETDDPADRLSQQLDRWEQLVNFFEVVEKDSKREEARKRRRQAAGAAAEEDVTEGTDGGKAATAGPAGTGAALKKGAAAGGAAAAAVGAASSLAAELEELGLGSAGDELLGLDEQADDEARGEIELDWQSLEQLFLGDGWESELTELKAKVEQGAREAEAAMAAQEGEEGMPVEPWRDEVSTLLLGLVEISAKRYLGRSLVAAALGSASPAAGAAPPGEEERAAAFWEAPFLLLVQDDSADQLLEYANRATLEALRLGSFEEATAGLSTGSLVDPADSRSQQEWVWACTDAAEKVESFSTIPELRLCGWGPGSPIVVATDVTVFRVDSLEGEPVGQAILATGWKTLPAGNA